MHVGSLAALCFRRARASLALASLLLVGCGSEVDGQMTSIGGELGDWTLEPSSCRAAPGAVEFFVTFEERMRLRIDDAQPRGWGLHITIPRTQIALLLDSRECKELEARWAPGSDGKLEGEVAFDCAARGGRAHGRLAFRACD